MNYQVVKEYNTKIRFGLLQLENTVNDLKIIPPQKNYDQKFQKKFCFRIIGFHHTLIHGNWHLEQHVLIRRSDYTFLGGAPTSISLFPSVSLHIRPSRTISKEPYIM